MMVCAGVLIVMYVLSMKTKIKEDANEIQNCNCRRNRLCNVLG